MTETKKTFELPFIGTETEGGLTLLYSAKGDCSVIFEITNAALQYGADPGAYEGFHALLGQLVKLLGAGHILQKTDIISRKTFEKNGSTESDYLSRKYFAHFEGRQYADVTTYLTVTRQQPGGRFFTYDKAAQRAFLEKVAKVKGVLENARLLEGVLDEKGMEKLFSRFRAFNFSDERFALPNLYCDDRAVYLGEKQVRVLSLIDLDELNLPTEIGTHGTNRELGPSFPVDNMAFLLGVPAAETVLYNQVVSVPDQAKLRAKLELKKKRHSSMPDPANRLSVQDIEDMAVDIAQENEMLVYAHFGIQVCATAASIDRAAGAVEGSLFSLGIIPGKNTYNQMELYRAAIPGNAAELKAYDLFLTSRPAALCFFFKERLPVGEKSHYLLHYTDRQGIPLGIDTSELPRATGRINNRNRFILGPSGSGKSFLTNTYCQQCMALGADIVIVDTGGSYSGLCDYLGGRYITYTEEKPITMNPFLIERAEFNLEKVQLLVSLVAMILKGVDGTLTQVEDDILTRCVTGYFEDYFGKREKVVSLSFNTFYDYSVGEIARLQKEDGVGFDLDGYRFILKKFYRGGMYGTILNDDMDGTLFGERFIVFEIDNIKEHKLLFPITTLIIMDVFLQKMRHRKNKKILIIEEAWKAIASPLMAGYILYLYKTVRKWGGEAIVVTQDLSDIIGNPIVKDSIISNSDTLFLLDQSRFRDRYDEIADILSLSEVERSKVFTVNRLDNREGRGPFKEVYIRRGLTGEVYGIEVPMEQYMTFTTERSEKEAFRIYRGQYPDFETAMDALVRDLNFSGLSLALFVDRVNTTGKIVKPLNAET